MAWNFINAAIAFAGRYWKQIGGGIFTLLVAPIAFEYFIAKNESIVTSVNEVFGSLSRNWPLATLVILMFAVVVAAIIQKREVIRFLRWLEPERYKRFEDVFDNEVKYGYVPFFPTIIAPKMGMRPSGVGIELLDEIFNGRLKDPKKAAGWNNIFDELEKGTFDIIATPLYDISERRRHVSFSMPVFYADIGLFTSTSNSRIVQNGPKLATPSSFVEVVQQLQAIHNKLTIRGCEGELQIKMARKYFPKSQIVVADLFEYTINAALEGLNADREEDTFSDIVFCERAQAELSPALQNGQIINLLRPGQLLFPVAFAIRKNEDTLRKFVNLRLMGIEGTNNSGISDRLVKQTKRAVPDMSEDDIRGYFRNAIDGANAPKKRDSENLDNNVVGLRPNKSS